MDKNLFNTWYNSLFTIICLVIIFFLGWNLINWIFTQAQWQVVEANLRIFMVGRYPQSLYQRVWISTLIASTLTFLTFGVFLAKQNIPKLAIIISAFLFGLILIVLPVDINSRLWLIGIGFSMLISLWLGKYFYKSISPYLAFAWLLSFPIILYLIGGGLGLRSVSSSDWNGLLLTLLMAAISIFLSFP
ncbi:MAG: amino acid ABC transporter permease, partial [Cyanobacteria bacterium J06641_2]